MIYWFSILFAISILVSQSAMDLFATLLTLAVLARLYKKWRCGEGLRTFVFPVGLEKFWILWLGIVGLSFVLSPLENTSALQRILEFRWIFLLYVLTWALQDLRVRTGALKPAAMILGFCSLYAIVVWFLGFDPINPSYNLAPWEGGHRTGGFLSNAMNFGHIYGLAFCLFVGPALMSMKWKSPAFKYLLAALVLTGVAVLLSFTRGMWIGMGIATLVMAFMFRARFGFLIAGFGSAILAIAYFSWPTLQHRLTSAFTSGDERQWIWKAHSQIFLDHPWLGVGYGENHRLLPQYYQAVGAPTDTILSHAHNQYLHFLAGTGVFGLLCYLYFLGFFAWLNWRVYSAVPMHNSLLKGLALGCFGAQIAFFIGGLTEANFEHAKLKYAMVIVWSIVLWLAHEFHLLRQKL